jgi:membrane-associated phospholipid phosphatase
MIQKPLPPLLILLFACLASADPFPPPAAAEPPPAFENRPRDRGAAVNPPYSLSLGVDLPLVAGALALNRHSGAMLRDVRSNPLDLRSLDRGSVPSFDRWAIGFHSAALSNVSSGLAWSEFAMPAALASWEVIRGQRPWHGALTDAVILQEALMISGALSNYAKSFPIHSTPLTYDASVGMDEKRKPQNVSSFFSNHTSTAFTIATFTGYTYQLRHPESPLVPWVWGTGLSMAAGVGALRVMAGKHFPSDVLMGAAVGSLCGYFTPRLHLNTGKIRGSKRDAARASYAAARASESAVPEKPGSGIDIRFGVGFPAGSDTPGPTVSLSF